MKDSMKTLQIIALILPALLLGAASTTHVNEQDIRVVAKKYRFEPSEITLHKGEPVTLELDTSDVPHGILIKELGVKAEARKDHPAVVKFVPQTVGTFKGKCARFCGVGHGSMTLTVHVVE